MLFWIDNPEILMRDWRMGAPPSAPEPVRDPAAEEPADDGGDAGHGCLPSRSTRSTAGASLSRQSSGRGG